MASSSTYAFFHCHFAFQKFPFFCVTLCVLHALQNATESHSVEHATHTERHKRTGTFEMHSGSERMHIWRRTPSAGRNFQTLIIWITVSWKASCNGSISVNNFFSWISSIFVRFFKSSRFFVSPCRRRGRPKRMWRRTIQDEIRSRSKGQLEIAMPGSSSWMP